MYIYIKKKKVQDTTFKKGDFEITENYKEIITLPRHEKTFVNKVSLGNNEGDAQRDQVHVTHPVCIYLSLAVPLRFRYV